VISFRGRGRLNLHLFVARLNACERAISASLPRCKRREKAIMGGDDLFARVERGIIDNRLLRDQRRFLEQEIAKVRHALRSAVLEMANLRAAIEADRRRNATRGEEPELPVESDRLECMKTYIESQQDALLAFQKRMLN
jgi:hypothetical protein